MKILGLSGELVSGRNRWEIPIPMSDRRASEDRITNNSIFLFLAGLFKYHSFGAYLEIKCCESRNTGIALSFPCLLKPN